MTTSKFKVVLVYPDLLGTYGDSGNAEILVRRATLRGVDAELRVVHSQERLDDSGDVYVLGGGEDGPQQAAVDALRRDGVLKEVHQQGRQILAICAGFQIIGESFATSDVDNVPGLGLIPVVTRRGRQRRCVGELLCEASSELGIALLSGYENHGGQTEILDGNPLGRVIRGVGNRYEDTQDGYLSDNVIASYAHGPLLARNPALADRLLERVHGLELESLRRRDIGIEAENLRRERIKEVQGNKGSVRTLMRRLTQPNSRTV